MGGNRGVKGLGATDSTLWGSVSQLCRVQRFRKRQSCAGCRGGRQRESHQQGEPRGRDQCPGASHALPRLAVQRTKEMLRTQATSAGDLGVVRQCVWGDQEGLSVVEIHSIATEMLSWG